VISADFVLILFISNARIGVSANLVENPMLRGQLINFVGYKCVTLSHRGNGAICDYQLLTRCVVAIVFITPDSPAGPTSS